MGPHVWAGMAYRVGIAAACACMVTGPLHGAQTGLGHGMVLGYITAGGVGSRMHRTEQSCLTHPGGTSTARSLFRPYPLQMMHNPLPITPSHV